MNINENNIIYSKPISEVPNISLGQYLFNNLHNNPNDIAQVSFFQDSSRIITSCEILNRDSIEVIFYRYIYIFYEMNLACVIFKS